MIDLSKLNESQQLAVKTIFGPLLCLAGAGTGKTTTLTYRVAYMLSQGINPSSILLLTFTNKAADEMLTRIVQLVGNEAGKVQGGTFHHFSFNLIKQYGKFIDLPENLSVLKEKDSNDVILSLLHSHQELYSRYRLPYNRSSIYEIISTARSYGITIEEALGRFRKNADIDFEAIELVYKDYTKYKKQNHLLDFDDLLEYALILLKNDKILDLVSKQYQFVMVDEYQDTNKIQADITNLISKKNRNLMVVGDDAQSIYAFRGSRVENIREFSENYPDCQIIKLEENYRSFGNILAASNAVIAKSLFCIPKKLYTSKVSGNKIAIRKFDSLKQEAEWISDLVIWMNKQFNIKLKDIAILFRNSRFTKNIEESISYRLIPYKKFGGPKFFDLEHVRHVIAYLRILNNPYDRLAWNKILLSIKGIGLQTANSIFETISKQLEPFDLSNIKIKSEIKSQLLNLSKLLLASVPKINEQPYDLFNNVMDYCIPYFKNKYPEDFKKRLSDFDEIAKIASRYGNLSSFIADISFGQPDSETEDTVNDDKDFLTLSTIHSAKGLEWKHVIIAGAVNGNFPSISSQKDQQEFEEERRLMYVAMTRAKESLTFTCPIILENYYSYEPMTQLSCFVEDIPQNFREAF